MNRTLRIWIKDTVAAEMRFSYRRIQALPFEYDFIPRYADFYVNLLTRMFNILNMEDSEEHDDNRRKAELLNLAHGMEIFNERWKQADFEGVNRNDNALYVAALYYLCDYEAVAAMYIRDCRLELLKTDAARLIFYVISGGAEDKEIKDYGIKLWLLDGSDSVISKYKADLEMCAEKLNYESADDFLIHYYCFMFWISFKKIISELIYINLMIRFLGNDISDIHLINIYFHFCLRRGKLCPRAY